MPRVFLYISIFIWVCYVTLVVTINDTYMRAINFQEIGLRNFFWQTQRYQNIPRAECVQYSM